MVKENIQQKDSKHLVSHVIPQPSFKVIYRNRKIQQGTNFFRLRSSSPYVLLLQKQKEEKQKSCTESLFVSTVTGNSCYICDLGE